MYEDLKTGIIEFDEYKMFKEKYKTEKVELQLRLDIINKKLIDLESNDTKTIEIERLYKKYSEIKEITKEILDEFVEKIFVGQYQKETNVRDIKIKWRYQF